MTAGSAILTAGVVALNPVTGPVPDPPKAVQTVQLNLSAVTNPLEAGAILAGGISSSLDVLASEILELPAALIVGAYDLGQQNNKGLYFTARQYVDAPWAIASPTFEALAQIFPEPLGGTDGDPWNNTPADGAIVDFVDQVLWAGAEAVNAQIAQALNVDPATGNPLDPVQAGPPANLAQGAITLAVGIGGTAVRILQGVAVSPLTVAQLAVGIAGALTTGNNTPLYRTVRNIIDAPLWAADPTIDALAKVMPRPLGGTDGKHEVSSAQDGQMIKFRDKVLWGATDAARRAVAKALDVDPANGDPLPTVRAIKADDAVKSDETPSSSTSSSSAPSSTGTATTPARLAGRVSGSTSVEKFVPGEDSSARATKHATETATKPSPTTVRTQVKQSGNRLDTAVKGLRDRLRGNTKKPAAQKESTQRTSAKKASADAAD
ncbi:hypothetical protein [Mycobacterium sp. GA-1841]|uniref:hypothetical protein n=1 Tax=Mycobacterium sp. GA-1841 TaxID=1834154 RepID=UPI0011157073|nr:hypothetical protein [Mycobacterium sp. GA-1841]